MALAPAVAHHALRVLRLHEGDALVLFDGQGLEAPGTLMRRGADWTVCLEAPARVGRESPLRLVLVQALPTADKMDWVLQKAVELGVTAVQPLRAERCVLRLSGERERKRLAHWRQVMIAACEQCGRNVVPQLRPLIDLAHYLAQPADGVTRLVLDPLVGRSLRSVRSTDGEIHFLVGPEGGWSAHETTACEAAGCVGVTLGPRILRTETAGLAALSAMQALWGDY